jgi:hypothetical protein
MASESLLEHVASGLESERSGSSGGDVHAAARRV